MTEENLKKKPGRPKKTNGYTDDVSTQYLDLCKQGKGLSQIASHFGITEKTLNKWKDDPRKSKLGTVWELGFTYCKAYHENLLEEMIADKKVMSHQINSQQHRMAVMFQEWNLKKESKITVNNRFEELPEKELDKEVLSMIKRKNHKEFLVSALNLNEEKDSGRINSGTSDKTH